MPPTSSKLSRRDRGRSRERSPRKRVRTFSQSTKRSSTERLSASPRHSTPSRRSKTPRRRSAELSASGSPSGSTHSSKSRRSPRSRSHSLASSRSPSPKRPSASTRRSKPSHRSKTSRRRSPSSSMRSAKPQPGLRSRSRSPTSSRLPSVEPIPDFEAVDTERPTSARHSSPAPSRGEKHRASLRSPSISPTRRSKVDRRRHVSLRSPPSNGDDTDPPRASSKRTREPRARQPELIFNGARLGSLMAHLSGGGSPPALVEALVSRVCDDRACECRKEFDLVALLANHKEARPRLERLMRCSKFTLVDQATAIVLAGNQQETIDKFNMWNVKHQRAVSHFCRVEGVLRAVAAHVGAAHLLRPLDDSSPHGIRAPRTSRRRGPPQQQPNHCGAHFPSLASSNGPPPSPEMH